ncbi:hypothetical protein EV426DRAFT_611154 [Tirmania nivea]|nr:hypothetical protein EV426DRAFT_611154 [Tirmania nivea]
MPPYVSIYLHRYPHLRPYGYIPTFAPPNTLHIAARQLHHRTAIIIDRRTAIIQPPFLARMLLLGASSSPQASAPPGFHISSHPGTSPTPTSKSTASPPISVYHNLKRKSRYTVIPRRSTDSTHSFPCSDNRQSLPDTCPWPPTHGHPAAADAVDACTLEKGLLGADDGYSELFDFDPLHKRWRMCMSKYAVASLVAAMVVVVLVLVGVGAWLGVKSVHHGQQ